MTDRDIYDTEFVTALFDEMSATYAVTNYVSSFGFCERWRRQTVEGARIDSGMVVVDLMSGMGECWRFVHRRLATTGKIIAVDVSSEMCRGARLRRERLSKFNIDVVQDDALTSALPAEVADRVIACFGLKTYSLAQLDALSREVWRLLKPGGRFSFVEIAVPTVFLLRSLYLFYLRHLIPVIGRLFLGNPDNYRLLAVYTEKFAGGASVQQLLEAQGFDVQTENLFFGCARRITGVRA